MKAKTSLLALSVLFGGAMASNAAVFLISNIVDFQTDTLYATANNVPMTSGLVSIGYFGSTIVDSDIDTIPELFSQLGSFTTRSSFVPGSTIGAFSIAIPGYAENGAEATSFGQINLSTNSALLNRTLYSIVTDAASLGLATATSGFALLRVGTIGNDEGGELSYSSNPAGITPLIGTNDTLEVNLGIDFDGPANGDPNNSPPLPASTYGTLKLSAVPEPSALLLSAFGTLALLRRKR